jgi:DNA polymerase epsilon subunit 1
MEYKICSLLEDHVWTSAVPVMSDFPIVRIHVSDMDNLYQQLDWQKIATRMMLKHYFRIKMVLKACVDQSRYFQVPIGNVPEDTTIFGCDIFYARNLIKQNFVLWCSPSERPDLGGKEAFDNRYDRKLF